MVGGDDDTPAAYCPVVQYAIWPYWWMHRPIGRYGGHTVTVISLDGHGTRAHTTTQSTFTLCSLPWLFTFPFSTVKPLLPKSILARASSTPATLLHTTHSWSLIGLFCFLIPFTIQFHVPTLNFCLLAFIQ